MCCQVRNSTLKHCTDVVRDVQLYDSTFSRYCQVNTIAQHLVAWELNGICTRVLGLQARQNITSAAGYSETGEYVQTMYGGVERGSPAQNNAAYLAGALGVGYWEFLHGFTFGGGLYYNQAVKGGHADEGLSGTAR